MKPKRNAFCLLMLVFSLGMVGTAFAQPIFENSTPTGFSPSDSTRKQRFVTDTDITVLVDLNEAANATYPVIGNFQKVEKSVPYFTTPGNAAHMSQAVAVDDNGVIHRAWIQQRGVMATKTASTPAYGVVYSKSFDGGATFTDTVSVSGSMRFDMITTNLAMTGAFSTVDLVVDSNGNPRVTYAFDFSADAYKTNTFISKVHSGAPRTSSTARGFEGIFFNYSNDGGSSWLPSNNTVTISDTLTVGSVAGTAEYPGRNAAFPRMAITSTNDIFIVYERSTPGAGGGANTDTDIMLAKVDADSLVLGSAQQVMIGGTGTVGSMGGIMLDVNNTTSNSPDIAVGDDDVLHVTYFTPSNSATSPIVYKSAPADYWNETGSLGWSQGSVGATVGTFDTQTNANNHGMHMGFTTRPLAAAVADHIHLFPSIVVDRERTPDRVYVLWKHTDATKANVYRDENIAYAFYNYDGLVGAGSNGAWSTTAYAFPLGHDGSNAAVTGQGSAMFQNGALHVIEENWAYVDRVSAVIDRRIPNVRGDLHIAFSGGESSGKNAANTGNANAIYYSRFNGNEWELPQVLATLNNGQADGIYDSDYSSKADAHIEHSQIYGPDLALDPTSDSIMMTFVGGDGNNGAGTAIGTATGTMQNASGFGFQGLYTADVRPLPYFKVIGRVTTFEDKSTPVGAFQYQMTYNPVNPQSAFTNNLVSVTVGDNADGSGIGASTPGTSAAPGGFLTGQWQRLSTVSLGVTTLTPGTANAVFKGANSQSQASNDVGVFEGLIDESGSAGFAEWGDDGDKAGLLVKLNVLGSDSSTNVALVGASSAAGGHNAGATVGYASKSQSINVQLPTVAGPVRSSFVKGITVGNLNRNAITATAGAAATGSFFILGADIDVVASNSAPSVSVVSPDANTLSGGTFANENFTIQYTLFDSDDNSTDTDSDTLRAALYVYPDNGLKNVQDIKTFATLIVDERDVTNAKTRATGDPTATDDFIEGSSTTAVQNYTWDDPGTAYQTAFGYAPVTKTLDGTYFVYIVADDGVNPSVYAVSAGALRVRHIPIVRSVAPVAADTVDTGEYSNLAKSNPYSVKFTVVDYDDNAQVRLFYSTLNSLQSSDVTVTGTFPNQTLELAGASVIQLSDSLRSAEDVEFDFNVAAQGANRDSVVAQGNYFVYAVAADEDTFAIGVSTNNLAVRHSPSFEFTSPLLGVTLPLDTSQQDRYTIEWQRGRSDQDLDGNAIISLYYTGIDPNTVNYSGTDSTRLVATSGTNPGNAVLIAGGIREDAEGEDDQYIWDFRNPPGALPKVFRPKSTGSATPANSESPEVFQFGATVDTAWVYAVLSDSLGNTRVEAGGAVLLRSGDQGSFQETPRVTMRTPPAGGQTIVNGDIVRLEWDAFLVDDGTGTDDAYLRLYAAPKGKYATLTALESNARGRGGSEDVYIINSLTGQLHGTTDTQEAYDSRITTLRESGDNYLLWDTKTSSFNIQGTPTEFDIFIAGKKSNKFGAPVYGSKNATMIDSSASGFGSQAQKAVLSKAPGSLRVEGADPIYSIEMGPGTMSASSGDTLEMDLLVNSQNSSVDLMAIHLDVPRNYFEVVDMDTDAAGVQPFADSTGAFKTPSIIAQNDTTQGTDQFIKLNFVESIITGEVIGNATGDSSQVAARLKLVVKRFSGGAPFDTTLTWSMESGRRTAFRRGTTELAAPAREVFITLTPNARIIATAPLEGRSDYADTLDIHLREIGSTQDITNQVYIVANDVNLDTTSSVTSLNISNVVGTFVADETVTGGTSGATATVSSVSATSLVVSSVTGTFTAAEVLTGGTSAATAQFGATEVTDVVLGDSVQVVSNSFGTFTLTEIPPGIYEMTVKADGYVSGRTDTLNVFNGLTLTPDPTYGSDVLGNLSPTTPLGFLRGGDATGDNQVDIADANLIYSLWNYTPANASYVRAADVNADGVVNSLDLGFVTSNFGNDGYGAAPVFKPTGKGGDNATAMVEVEGIEEVESWWPGRVFEVTARAASMSDVMAYELVLGYDPERVKLLPGEAVVEGDVFANNAKGALFFSNAQPGRVEVTSGRIGRDWSASGDAELVTVRFVALADDPGVIDVLEGQFVNSAYQGTVMRVEKAQALPLAAALHQNFPNPFNPSTEIRFDIPTARTVQLRVYNQLGQTVRTLVDNRMKAGSYRMKWDGKTEAGNSVSSGVYFYSLEAGDYSQIRKMTLVK